MDGLCCSLPQTLHRDRILSSAKKVSATAVGHRISSACRQQGMPGARQPAGRGRHSVRWLSPANMRKPARGTRVTSTPSATTAAATTVKKGDRKIRKCIWLALLLSAFVLTPTVATWETEEVPVHPTLLHTYEAFFPPTVIRVTDRVYVARAYSCWPSADGHA